jgi:hypothetical protein
VVFILRDSPRDKNDSVETHLFRDTAEDENRHFQCNGGGNSAPHLPLISVAPPEPHRGLTVVPSIRIEGTTVRLRWGPRQGLVKGWRTGGQELDCLGCQAGFGWVAETREARQGPELGHRLARDP